jgi:hypothetical protein
VLSIEALGLLLIVLYVIDAVVVCDPATTQIVGWEPGTARLRKGLRLSLGRTRLIAMGRLLPPLDPPLLVNGHRLETRAVATLCARMREELRLVRVLTNLLFAAVFVVLPGAVLVPTGLYGPAVAVLFIGISWLAVAAVTIVAVRRLFPEAKTRPGVAATLLSPISAIRVSDVVVRRLLAEWHPVAVARVQCRREDYLALARAACFSASESRGALTRFLRAAGDWEAVQAAPAAEDGCMFYCPKCHAQFAERSVGCRHCCVSLRPHRAAAPAAAAPAVTAVSLPIEGATWPAEGRT